MRLVYNKYRDIYEVAEYDFESSILYRIANLILSLNEEGIIVKNRDKIRTYLIIGIQQITG